MLNNYDRIARIYDRLSRMVFGKAIVRAQQSLLPFIVPNARILIAGGGTGWILEELANVHPSGLTVDYVEISSNMLELAKQRDCKGNAVAFIHSAIEDYTAPAQYDVAMTPFLFDNFNPDRAKEVFRKMNDMLEHGGLWLFADFHIDQDSNRFWQKALLRSMYFFFRKISHVEARHLPDMQALFARYHFKTEFENCHFGRFIRSAAYRKSGDGGTASAENKPFVEEHDR